MAEEESGSKTILIFIGMPYTGKTTLIQHLQRRVPGEAIYTDQIFSALVPPAEISLSRWVAEGPNLIDRIRRMLRDSKETVFYVELGVMKARPRSDLIRWARAEGYRVIPLWLQCEDFEALLDRQRQRLEELGQQGDVNGLKLGIDLDKLYHKIKDAFEEPTVEEGFLIINTEDPLEESVATIVRLHNTNCLSNSGVGVLNLLRAQ